MTAFFTDTKDMIRAYKKLFKKELERFKKMRKKVKK